MEINPTMASNLVPNNEVKVHACNFTSYEILSIHRNPLIFWRAVKKSLINIVHLNEVKYSSFIG